MKKRTQNNKLESVLYLGMIHHIEGRTYGFLPNKIGIKKGIPSMQMECDHVFRLIDRIIFEYLERPSNQAGTF